LKVPPWFTQAFEMRAALRFLLKLAEVQFPASHFDFMEADVGQTRVLHLFLGPTEHVRLNVDRHDVPSGAYFVGHRNSETARTAANIKHTHPGLEVQVFNDDTRAITSDKWTVKLHQPTQPGGAGQNAAERRESPREEQENA
jgi:hypothetical protein